MRICQARIELERAANLAVCRGKVVIEPAANETEFRMRLGVEWREVGVREILVRIRDAGVWQRKARVERNRTSIELETAHQILERKRVGKRAALQIEVVRLRLRSRAAYD